MARQDSGERLQEELQPAAGAAECRASIWSQAQPASPSLVHVLQVALRRGETNRCGSNWGTWASMSVQGSTPAAFKRVQQTVASRRS